jgi:hypothetical protein
LIIKSFKYQIGDSITYALPYGNHKCVKGFVLNHWSLFMNRECNEESFVGNIYIISDNQGKFEENSIKRARLILLEKNK